MNKEKRQMWEHYRKLCKVEGVEPIKFEIVESDGSRPKDKMFSDWVDHYGELVKDSDSVSNVVWLTKAQILDKYGHMITEEQWNEVMEQIQEEE